MSKDQFIHMRSSGLTRKQLDDLRAAEPDQPPMSEMVRRLISRAHKQLQRKASRKQSKR